MLYSRRFFLFVLLAAALAACGEDPQSRFSTLVSGGRTREFYLSLPADYDSSRSYALYVGIHGRDYDGYRMRNYLGLETVEPRDDEIFVYPNALKRKFGSQEYIGWQNGPVAGIYGGMEDIVFFRDLLNHLRERYNIDERRIFATGQSWGGDFSNVVGCFLGDVFRAIVPVAANGAYYLPSPEECLDDVAVWAMHGKADPYFPIHLGWEYRDFWMDRHGCDGSVPLVIQVDGVEQADDDCLQYTGCSEPTRWCAYNERAGHQIPWAYFSEETMRFFRSFD